MSEETFDKARMCAQRPLYIRAYLLACILQPSTWSTQSRRTNKIVGWISAISTIETKVQSRLWCVRRAPGLIPKATCNRRSMKPWTLVQNSPNAFYAHTCVCAYVVETSTDGPAIYCTGRDPVTRYQVPGMNYARGAILLTSERYPRKQSENKYLLCDALSIDPPVG